MAVEIIQWFQPHLLKRFEKETIEALHGDYTIQDILFMWRTGQLRGVAALVDSDVAGYALYTIVEYPRKRRLRVHVLAGRHFDLWGQAMLEYLKQQSQALGLDGVECVARKGFSRIAKGAKELSFLIWEVKWELEQAEL
ncbi:MAG: hypothetical protein N3E46_10165 [Gemmataceae bacterium]|nr:hypothetical protein [Gemmataceae bacterium]